MGGPDRPWVPPGAGPHPPGAEPVRGAPIPTEPTRDEPPAGPPRRRWPLLAAAAAAGPDRQSGLVMTANRAGVVEGGPQEAAEHWAGGPLLEETPTFEPFPRDGLDIRCARSGTGAVCYVDGPRLEVVMTGSPTASRMASLLAEAYRKMLG